MRRVCCTSSLQSGGNTRSDSCAEAPRALRRVAEHLLGIALLDDDAAVHEDHAVAHGAGKGHLVRDDDHGHFFLREITDDLEHLAGQLGIERAGRLVEKEDVGPQRQRAGDGDALLLSAGELAGVGVRLVRKAHLFEQGERQLTHLAALAPLHSERRVRHVFEHRGMQCAGTVEHQPEAAFDPPQRSLVRVDALSLRVHRRGKVVPVGERAAVHRFKQRRAAQQRRFAAAAGADDRDGLTLAHGEGNALEHLQRAEGLADVLHGQYVHVRSLPHW